MKAIYQKPVTEVVTCKCEDLVLASPNNINHADSKKGFFDDDDDMKSDLWDDDLWSDE